MTQPLLSIAAARRALGGIGKTKLYELIASGELKKVKIGGRTLVTRESIEDLIVVSHVPVINVYVSSSS